MKNSLPIRYRIFPENPEAHLFVVTCTVDDPDPQGQRFALPAWIPGSYMIREFARHVVTLSAKAGRKPLAIAKLDKHTWITAPVEGPVTVTMEAYAWDLSVRGAHLDSTHAFFNGPCVFLRVLGREDRPCEVDILRPIGARYSKWRLATGMRRHTAPAHGFGTYKARDYEELIDHPVEMGTFTLATFTAVGVPHEIAITGRHNADLNRLCRDLKKLCEYQIHVFGAPAPMDRYVFLVTALGEGYGGLEHRSSTALLCSREDLPEPSVHAVSENYRTFLGLCSHEYFHTWNVKRIKPAVFSPYDLERENYTTLLWAFEGITSYYDDLTLVRAGLISEQDYLEILGKNITALLRNAGRLRQTVAQASWDAWIKYYRQDENSPNSQVSYYLKGSLIALCLDLLIRQRTRNRKSLDDVMRVLWQRYGQSGIGVPEDAVEGVASEVAGVGLRSFFNKALRSTEELPLKQMLATVGATITLRQSESSTDKGGRPASTAPGRKASRITLGVRTTDDPAGIKLTHVLDGGSAQLAGLSAGDVVVAIDGLKATSKTLERRLSRFKAGDRVRLHFFRRDELADREISLQVAPLDTCTVTVTASDATARRRREGWLRT